MKKGHDVTLVVFNSLSQRDCGYGITYEKPYLVIKPEKPILPKEQYFNGVKILRFESKLQFLSYYWSPTMLVWLLKNAGKFDIMHTHCLRFSNNEFTALANIRSGTPFILTGHSKLNIDYKGPMANFIDKVYRSTIGKSLLNKANNSPL